MYKVAVVDWWVVGPESDQLEEKLCILVVGSKSGGGRSDYNNAKVGRILEILEN